LDCEIDMAEEIKKDNMQTLTKIITVIIFLLLVLSISSGCGLVNIFGLEITSIGAGKLPVASSAVMQSASANGTVGTLPRSVIDSLGTGFKADIVLEMAGLNASSAEVGQYRFLAGEDHNVTLELKVVRLAGDLVILTAIQSDKSGHKLLFSPKPDTQPIDDFLMKSGDLILDVGEYYQLSVLWIALGDPLRVDSSTEATAVGTAQRRFKTLYYLDLTIDLWQPSEPEYADNWLISQINFTSSEYTSPRGLAVGLLYQEVLSLLGTGDFTIFPDSLPAPTRLMISKNDSINEGTGKQIEIILKDGVVSLISIKYS
jgi:hypothetical protein